MYELAYQLQLTTTRNQVVFPHQIYLNLHNNNEFGCIGNDHDCSILEQVYYSQNSFKQNQNKLTVFVTPNFKIDEVFSLYLMNRLIKLQITDEQYGYLKQWLNDSKDQVHWLNLHILLLACKHINSPLMALEKLFVVLDELMLQPLYEPQFLLLKIEQLQVITQELTLIKADYNCYQQELIDATHTQRDELLVAMNDGKMEKVKGTFYYHKSNCRFLHNWLAVDDVGIVLTFAPDCCRIEAIQPHISIKRLAKTLTFFEQYHSKQASMAVWHGENKIYCNDTKLSHNKIIDIVKNYTDPTVCLQKVKYVFPFHFDYMQFDEVTNFLNRKFFIVDESSEHQQYSETFLPLVNDYFFNNNQLSEKQTHSIKFTTPKNAYVMIDGRNARFSFEKDLNVHPMYVRTINIEIRQFRYGVGFLVLESNFKPTDFAPLPYVLDIDQIICSKVQEVFQFFLGECSTIKTNATRRGITYESIEIQQASFYKERKENVVLKTCSINKRTYISEPEELKQELNDKYLSRGDYVFYGFSRSCGVQYLVDNRMSGENSFKKLSTKFMNEKFYIFLFAAQKRDAIRQFSDKLVGSSIVRQKLEANQIRKDFLDFMTQVKLSHISDHNVITRFYGRWEKIFESDAIFTEVSEKLTALDGYQQAKVSYQFTRLSFIVFPIVALSALFTMGIFKTTPFELDIYFVIIMNVVLIGLFYVFSRRR